MWFTTSKLQNIQRRFELTLFTCLFTPSDFHIHNQADYWLCSVGYTQRGEDQVNALHGRHFEWLQWTYNYLQSKHLRKLHEREVGLCLKQQTRLCLLSIVFSSGCLLLLYVSGAGLAIVEGQACNSPLPYLLQRQLLSCSLLEPSHPPPVCVGGPRHLAEKHKTWKDPGQTESSVCFIFSSILQYKGVPCRI